MNIKKSRILRCLVKPVPTTPGCTENTSIFRSARRLFNSTPNNAFAVFEPGTTDIRPQWRPRFDLLLEELAKAPAILRLTYLADLEDPQLVKARVKVVRKEIVKRWRALDADYRLELEHDVFWRRGAPAKKVVKRAGG